MESRYTIHYRIPASKKPSKKKRMTQFNDIINSLKEQIDILQTLENSLGSSSNLQSCNNRYKELSQISDMLVYTMDNLQLEMHTTMDSIIQLKEDINRIKLLQGQSSIQNLESLDNNLTLMETQRSLKAQRDSMLREYCQDLQTFFQTTTNYYILNSQLNNISTNDFNSMNKFVFDNFKDLQYCDLTHLRQTKPVLTLNTILDSYSHLTIHTPLKQVKFPSKSINSPARKIYRTPQNSVTKQKKFNTVMRLARIDTQNNKTNYKPSIESPFLYGESLLNPQTPLQKLLSPINIINKRVSNRENGDDNDTRESPVIMITPTKSAFKNLARQNSRRSRTLSCKITNGLMKSC